MGIEPRYGKDKKLINHWYGKTIIHGKPMSFALETIIKGTPPILPNGRISLKGKGDPKFEECRLKAINELKGKVEEAKRKGRATHLTERLIESKTGTKVRYHKLSDLPSLWREADRDDYKPTESYLKWCDSVFKRFAAEIPCEYLYQVTAEMAKAYIEQLRKKLTIKTVGSMKSILKSAFGDFLPTGVNNPFGTKKKGRKTKRIRKDDGSETIGRRPLNTDELERLFNIAKTTDQMLYGLAVVATFTALRIGDVCNLKWSNIDLRDEGWVTVLTSKTGQEVIVPFLDSRIREVFEEALAQKEPDAIYVFPEAQKMYGGITDKGNSTRNMIYYRGKVLFAKTFAKEETEPIDVGEDGLTEGRKVDLGKVLPQVVSAVKSSGFIKSKEDRIVDSLSRVAQGESYCTIEKETGRKKAIVSQDLKDAERVSKLTFRKGPTKKSNRDIKTLIAATQQPRKVGAHSASLYGWHNLRGTFCCLAFAAGYDLEFVSKATGHSLARTMRDHYFNPRRDHWRGAMKRASPLIEGKEQKQIQNITPKELPPASPDFDAIAKQLGLTREQTKQFKELWKPIQSPSPK